MIPLIVNAVSFNACNHRDFEIGLYETQAALVKDPGVSVNRVIWSPDGSLFGKHNGIGFFKCFITHKKHVCL